MKTTRNLILICLIEAMLLASSVVVQAQFSFATNGVSVTITGYTGTNDNVVIPDETGGYPITSIGQQSFFDCTNLTSVTIPNSVTSIGENAFEKCVSLTSLNIGSGVTSYEPSALVDCPKLVSLTIGCPNIGTKAFSGLSLTSVTLLNSVTNIGSDAFENCTNLTSLNIGSGVTSFGNGALFDCPKLVSLTIGCPSIGSWFDGLSLTSVTLLNSVTNIGTEAFENCARLTNVRLPNSVTGIGNGAFYECARLTNLTIPESVTSIGSGAFYECAKLPSAVIPNFVTSIGNFAFYGCTSLINVSIGSGVTSIGNDAFADCTGLSGIYFPGNSPAPTNDLTVFTSCPATVYYVPGTTGWGAAFDGVPAVLWNPQAQTSDGRLGVQTNSFGFNITGSSNLVLVVEACTNLFNPVWIPLATNILAGGSTYFSDPQSTNFPGRFYRFSSP